MTKPHWIEKLTDTSKKLEVEAFEKNKNEIKNQSLTLIDRNDDNVYIIANKTDSSKTAVAARIDTDIIKDIDNMSNSSRNSVINALLFFAIKELKEKDKMLIFK